MALVQFTATAISGRKLPGATQSIVVNAARIFDWESYGSGSRFRYVMNPYDRRDKALLITVSDTVASKLASANTAFGDVICKLPVETTIGGDTTDRYVPVESLAWAESASGESDHSLLIYNQGGFKNVEVMIPFSLNDIVYVSSTGTSSS